MTNTPLKKLRDKTQDILFVTMLSLIFVLVAFFICYFILDADRLFSDFAETLSYCIVENPYSGEYSGIRSIYPPFAYLPFYLFALIAYNPIKNYVGGTLSLWELCKEPTFIVSFVLFFILCLILVLFLTAKISGFKDKKLIYLLGCITCFGPLLFCFYRGNNIISCLVFVMLFFWLHKSEIRWQREIANLCLACAIAIKIYPILILVYFIKDRRFLDMLKTLLYALILLFVPFLLIQGGFGNISHIWNNFTKFNSGQSRQYGETNISLDAFASYFSVLFNLEGTAFYPMFSKILRYGLLITAILVLALSKKSRLNMQFILLSLLTYELFMGVSYAYTLIFLIIPAIEYLKDFDKYSKVNKIYYGICFLIIALPVFASIKNFVFVRFVLVTLVIKCFYDIVKDIIVQKKQPKVINDILT